MLLERPQSSVTHRNKAEDVDTLWATGIGRFYFAFFSFGRVEKLEEEEDDDGIKQEHQASKLL